MFYQGKDGVVELVVQRVLGDQRRHAHHAESFVLRERAHALHVHARRRRRVDHRSDEEPAGLLVGEHEEVLGPGRQPGGHHADVHAHLVHDADQDVETRRVPKVTAEEITDALEPGLADERLDRVGGKQVHPDVDDV